MRSFKQLLAAFLLALLPGQAFAQTCPDIRGIADLNCDGKLQITFVGDSIVKGFGDTENNNRGGYVLRLQEKLPDVVIKNVSVNGLKTEGLLEILKNAFEDNSAPLVRSILSSSDVVIIDMGRNDRLDYKSVRETYQSLQSAAKKIGYGVFETEEFYPLVVTSVMMVPARTYLAPFVRKLDAIILKGNSPDAPSDLRFDKAGTGLLSKDKLHPSSKGYEVLSLIAEKYVLRELPLESKRFQETILPLQELTSQQTYE